MLLCVIGSAALFAVSLPWERVQRLDSRNQTTARWIAGWPTARIVPGKPCEFEWPVNILMSILVCSRCARSCRDRWGWLCCGLRSGCRCMVCCYCKATDVRHCSIIFVMLNHEKSLFNYWLKYLWKFHFDWGCFVVCRNYFVRRLIVILAT